MEAGRVACTRIGGPLLFERLWEQLGIAEVLGELLADRSFEFAVERAVFASVLHRLFVSGSDRSCDKWIADYRITGIDGLELHHLYRAMAWLGEEIGPAAAGALAPRCVKDVIEERLFERRRDLFSDLSLVFMDTTSPVVLRRRRREPGGLWPFQGPSARPEADDRGRRHRRPGPADLHRDAAG